MPTLPCKSVRDITYSKGMRVFVRASLNVPIEDGKVTNDFRLRREEATLRYLVERGCRVVVCGHIGRDGSESTAPIVPVLERFGFQAAHIAAVCGKEVEEAVSTMKEGSILVLENVRSDPREKGNDKDFASELAKLADVYVNEAFAASHREHASLVGAPALLPSYAGFNFIHEYEALSAMREPVSPSLFMIGGAKFSTKMPLIEKFIDVYDHVFVGGALANDFLKAMGYEIGESLVSDTDLTGSPLLQNERLLLPSDVVVYDGSQKRVCDVADVRPQEKIFDVGPQSVTRLASLITKAETILWNGPFGNYEAGFAEQTRATADLVADSSGQSVVGGGDTIASIEELGLEEQFTFLSTAGGAMLAFLETGSLPALEVLQKN